VSTPGAADVASRSVRGIRARLTSYGRPPRVLGIDLARGLAVLGMFGAHVGVAGGAFDWSTPSTWSSIVEGRSSILFAVVAGVSIALVTGGRGRLEGDALVRARLKLFARGALIFVIGGLLEYLGTGVAVILPVYGALFLLAAAFLRMRIRTLLLIAGALCLVAPLPAIFPFVYSATTDPILFGTYPVPIWLAFVLVGMALGRSDLTSVRVIVRIGVAGVLLAALGYGTGAAAVSLLPATSSDDPFATSSYEDPTIVPAADVDMTGLECEDYSDRTYYCYDPATVIGDGDGGDEGVDAETAEPAWWDELDPSYLISIDPHSGTTFEMVGSTGFALAVIALCLALARPLRWVLLPLAALGSMPLSAYSVHIVAIALIPDAIGGIEGAYLWPWFTIVALVACTVWWLLIGRGPLERLLGIAADAAAGVRTPRRRRPPGGSGAPDERP